MKVKLFPNMIDFIPETEEDQLTLKRLKDKQYYLSPGGGAYNGEVIKSLNFWIEEVKEEELEDWDKYIREIAEKIGKNFKM